MLSSPENTPLLASKTLSDGSLKCYKTEEDPDDVVICKSPQKKEKYLT